MPLAKPPEQWTEEDLRQMVDERLEESMWLEFKSDLNLSSESGRREACKDLSAFANAQGGTIVYGIGEKDTGTGRKVATELAPLTQPGLKERLEDVVLNGVTPRFEFSVLTVPSATVNGGYYLVVKVPQSFAGVHMVTLGGTNRYYKRRNFGSEPMTEEEVRLAYERVLRAREDARVRYVRDRFNPSRNLFAFQLATVPVYQDDRMFDPTRVRPEDLNPDGLLRRPSSVLRPYHRIPGGYMFANGSMDARFANQIRVLSNGLLEYTEILNIAPPPEHETNYLPTGDVWAWTKDYLSYFGALYAMVGYRGPVKVYLRLTGAKGSRLGVGRILVWEPPPFPESEYEIAVDASVDELAGGVGRKVKELMDLLWHAYGWPLCGAVDEDGNWRGL